MSSQVVILTVDDGAGERVDAFVATRVPDLTRSSVARLIDDGLVTVNGKPVKASHKLKFEDEVSVNIPPPSPTDIAAQDIPIDIIYEDSDIAIVNKPKGMTTHPAPGSPDGTLVNALLARISDLSGVGGVKRPGIVHRLDKDTSGLLVVAKNDAAHLNLQEQIKQRVAGRKYIALVWGDTKFEKAVVDAPIGRHPTHRQKMAVVTDRPTSREATTDLTVLERLNGFTLIEASLRTGRTHQIRVHTAYIGHPVVGDPTYSGRRTAPTRFSPREQAQFNRLVESLKGQALHAYKLSVDHPRTGERLEFESPLPDEMQSLIDWLREIRELPS